jgi:putative ABC transport system permease protein
MLRENLAIALRSLRANKMRSFLTMLGVIIGVASVITMLAVGSGAKSKVAEQIRSLGTNVLLIEPGTVRDGGVRKEIGSRHTLSESDARAIANDIPHVQVAAPSIRGRSQIVRGSKNWNTIVNGTTTDYFIARDWSLSGGRYFSKREEKSAGKVALVGTTVAREIFGDEEPIGQQIRILNVPFDVIGVLAEKGSTGTGRDKDDIIFVPISTAKIRLIGGASEVDRDSVAYILVKVADQDKMAGATEAIKTLLQQRHGLGIDQDDDFKITTAAATMAAQQAAATTISWLLAAIASISLVVGGVSIMNIMLVSVTERTREVGLRLALGARRRDIRNQFLTEAVSLCVLGGLIGVSVGTVSAWAVAKLAGWPIYLGPEAVLSAVAFAAGVGMFFGYYPARKAAKLEPVVALRSE